MEARIPEDEADRLAALYRLDLLDRPANENFDRLTRILAHVLDVPIALLSFVDADRQWFGSLYGLTVTETPRRDAFCAHAILDDDILVVVDTQDDARFRDNPLVTGGPLIRFYAGAPISAPSGHRLGTLCAIDQVPRQLDEAELNVLHDLAGIIERELSYLDMALSDELTGLANRRAFMAAGAQLVALGRRTDQPVSVVYADIDGLKTVNDDLGHHAGDELLRRCADSFHSVLRKADILARVGGDEFAAILYASDEDAAKLVERRLDALMAKQNALAPDLPTTSVSTGVAVSCPDETFAETVGRADQAMYAAKRARRT